MVQARLLRWPGAAAWRGTILLALVGLAVLGPVRNRGDFHLQSAFNGASMAKGESHQPSPGPAADLSADPSPRTGACGPLAIARPPRTEKRSFHSCINQFRTGQQNKPARCRFNNVCLRTSDGALLYFIGNDDPPEFEKPLLYLDKTLQFPLNPTLVSGEPPANATWYPGTAAYFNSYLPSNFGHALDDDFFAIYRLLRIFGLQKDADVMIVTKDKKPENCAPRPDSEPPCTHLKELTPYFARGIFGVENTPPELRTGTLFCARHLVAGTQMLGMGYDTEAIHDEFVEHLLCRLGLEARPKLPERPRIAIFEKKGRRRVTNSNAIAEAIRGKLSVDTDVLEIAKLSFREQLDIMPKYSLVISPSGGIAYTSAFLPPGAATIFVGAWDSKTNSSATIDRFIFTTRGRVRDYYYLPEFGELKVNTKYVQKGKSIPDDSKYRDFVDVTVNVDKMVKIAGDALRDIGYPRYGVQKER